MADNPLTPVLHERLTQLAALPPGSPTATTLIAEVLKLFASVAADPAVAAIIPVAWKPYIGAVVAAVLLTATTLGGYGVGRIYAPAVPVNVTVHPSPPAAGDIMPPAKVLVKFRLYVTTETDPKEVAKAGTLPGVAVHSKQYEPGSTHLFKNTRLPCVVWIDETGQVVDAVPFTTAADLSAWMKAK